jgi:hypothetical protein
MTAPHPVLPPPYPSVKEMYPRGDLSYDQPPANEWFSDISVQFGPVVNYIVKYLPSQLHLNRRESGI